MCCRGSGPNPDLILPRVPWQIDPKQNTEIWTQSLSHLMPFANATASRSLQDGPQAIGARTMNDSPVTANYKF